MFFVFPLKDIKRGVSYLRLRPDRVAMQDATAQVSYSKIRSEHATYILVDNPSIICGLT